MTYVTSVRLRRLCVAEKKKNKNTFLSQYSDKDSLVSVFQVEIMKNETSLLAHKRLGPF